MSQADIILRGGTIHDGSGGTPFVGDVVISGDKIAEVSPGGTKAARRVIDATGLAIAPGFINMLSWAGETLLADGRSQSDIRQGVTLEVMGEGTSMGPWHDEMKAEELRRQGDIRYDIPWSTVGGYLDHLVARGVSCNVASFVGATTLRIHEVGYDDRRATADELERMKALAAQAMREGAMGVSSALIYPPATCADTRELIELATVAAQHGGMYISHLRSEGDALLEALDEFFTIVRESGACGEVHHIKASGRDNWHKMDELLSRIAGARAVGLPVSANMYPYHASSTGLGATMPPWVQEGGHDAWVARLRDPVARERVKRDMGQRSTEWDNGWLTAGGPEHILLVGFQREQLKPLAGRTLAEVAAERGASPMDTAMDLVIEDDSDVGASFFSMSEENVRKAVRSPFVSFCSDARSLAPEGVFLQRSTHPRAYGAFARILGRYVRDEALIPLAEAVRRLTALPAANLKLAGRGRLAPGYLADVVAFDPATIRDHATFASPHQYATGMVHVLVNGEFVLEHGEHTGARPGRVVRGPGWRGQ